VAAPGAVATERGRRSGCRRSGSAAWTPLASLVAVIGRCPATSATVANPEPTKPTQILLVAGVRREVAESARTTG